MLSSVPMGGFPTYRLFWFDASVLLLLLVTCCKLLLLLLLLLLC